MQHLFGDRPGRWTPAVLLIAFMVLWLAMVREINVYDESIILVGGMRWLAGDMPHRDFYSNYGPGQYAIIAGLIATFGKNLYLIRGFAVLVMAGVIALTFHLLVRRVSPIFCLLGTGLCAAFVLAAPNYLYPVFPVILLVLLGSNLLLSGDRAITSGQAAMAGACAGAAALFRYDSGFFMLVAHCLAIVILTDGPGAVARIKQALAPVLAYGLAAATVFAPFAIGYLATSPLQPFVHDIIEFPVQYYSSMRGLPFPDLASLLDQPLNLGVYFPVLAAAVVVADLAISRPWASSGARDQAQYRLIVVIFALSAVLFYKGVVRVSTLHMLMSVIPATLLAAVAFDRFWQRRSTWLVIGLVPLVALAPALGVAREMRDDVRDPARTYAGWQVADLADAERCAAPLAMGPVRVPPKYAAVARYLKVHSRPQDRIFVGLDRHDRTFANAVGVYFLADRLPASHWHHFDPGLQSRADIQRAIIAELEAYRTRWIVRDKSFSAVREPNDSAVSSGIRLLDDFIDARYRPVARVEDVEIWLAKGDAPSASAPVDTDLADCRLDPLARL